MTEEDLSRISSQFCAAFIPSVERFIDAARIFCESVTAFVALVQPVLAALYPASQLHPMFQRGYTRAEFLALYERQRRRRVARRRRRR